VTLDELIGSRIRDAREGIGMSQAAFGQHLGRYLARPWSRQIVSVAELGQRSFSAGDLLALSLALNRPLAWLLSPDRGEKVTLPSGQPLREVDVSALGTTTPESAKAFEARLVQSLREALDELRARVEEGRDWAEALHWDVRLVEQVTELLEGEPKKQGRRKK
jgi:transcriptional regulator with XRE-family HTH domain